MLCYQSERDVSDIMRDTFRWITLNASAIAKAVLPAVGVCIALLIWLGYAYVLSSYDELPTNYKSAFDIFNIFGLDIIESSRLSDALCYAVTAFITSMALCPLLIRYFSYQMSLRSMTVSKHFELFSSYFLKTLFSSLITAVAVYIIVSANFWLAVVALCTQMVITPCVIMNYWEFHHISDHIWSALRGAAIILLVTVVIMALPSLLLMLSELLISSTSHTAGFFPPDDVWRLVKCFYVTITFCTFSIAVIFETIGAVILHGTICAKD